MKKRNLELYLHIPFCVRKCNYCDFFSASGTPKEQADYVSAMVQEIQSYQELSGEYEVHTIFLGGGTPSLLTPEQIEQIFNAIVAIGCAYLFIKPLMETGGSEMAAAGAVGGAV